MKKEIIVVSLFDGISCAQIALNKLGIKCIYYASEVDKFSIKCTQENYPNTIQLGDVSTVTRESINPLHLKKGIDLVIGGSPCQNFTSFGDKKGLDGKKSKLFFEYMRVLKELKPTHFLLENVGSMKHTYRDIISDLMGVEYVSINSNLFVPQNRRRLYWSNIPFENDSLPTHITQKTVQNDILENPTTKDPRYYYTAENKRKSFIPSSFNYKPEADRQIARPLKTLSMSYRAAVDNCYHVDYSPPGMTNLRKLTPIEYERLQGIPDNYTSCLSNSQRYKTIGNSFTVDVIEFLLAPIVN